jgi:serine/threonine protein kinase
LPDGRHERFDLSAEKSKEFALLLPPHATVMLEGELMLKASGKTLAQLIKEKKVSLGPDDVHFKKILIAVNEFLKATYPHNFIHRDLKPENILYDIDSGEVTIIDKGESSRLRSRDKNDMQTLLTKGRLSTNLETSTKQLGTRDYMAPSMFEGKEYGSEVDYFSAAMIFLKLINEKDFNNFNKNRLSGTVRDVFFQEEPSLFLSTYLNKINPQPKLTTESLTTKESFFNNEKKSFSPNIDDFSPLTLDSTIHTNLEMSPLEKGSFNSSDDTNTASLSIESNSNDSLEEGILSTEESLNKHPDVKEIIELYFQASAGGTPEVQSASRSALNKLDLIFRAYGDRETAKLDQGKTSDGL